MKTLSPANVPKLDPEEEQAFADLGMTNDLSEWPEY